MKKYIFISLLLPSVVAQSGQLNPKGVVPSSIVKYFSHPAPGYAIVDLFNETAENKYFEHKF